MGVTIAGSAPCVDAPSSPPATDAKVFLDFFTIILWLCLYQCVQNEISFIMTPYYCNGKSYCTLHTLWSHHLTFLPQVQIGDGFGTVNKKTRLLTTIYSYFQDPVYG